MSIIQIGKLGSAYYPLNEAYTMLNVHVRAVWYYTAFCKLLRTLASIHPWKGNGNWQTGFHTPLGREWQLANWLPTQPPPPLPH